VRHSKIGCATSAMGHSRRLGSGRMSASLIGRLGSSAFRLSAAAVSMSASPRMCCRTRVLLPLGLSREF
jgi:hypothetical protein